MATEQCRNCRFSKNMGAGLRCRRYPPICTTNGYCHQIVGPEDWCGEWMSMRPGAGLPVGAGPAPTSPSRAIVKEPRR